MGSLVGITWIHKKQLWQQILREEKRKRRWIQTYTVMELHCLLIRINHVVCTCITHSKPFSPIDIKRQKEIPRKPSAKEDAVDKRIVKADILRTQLDRPTNTLIKWSLKTLNNICAGYIWLTQQTYRIHYLNGNSKHIHIVTTYLRNRALQCRKDGNIPHLT